MAVTFQVEDGSGLPTATSYASVADVLQALEDRGEHAAFDALATEAQQVALNVATDYIDQRYGGRWRGRRVAYEQALDWPRTGVVDDDGFTVDAAAIPPALVEALAQAVKRHVAGTELLPDVDAGGAGIRREAVSVGPIKEDITYGGAGKTTIPVFRAISRILERAGLVTRSNRVYRQ